MGIKFVLMAAQFIYPIVNPYLTFEAAQLGHPYSWVDRGYAMFFELQH
jgi:hypothetical protein